MKRGASEVIARALKVEAESVSSRRIRVSIEASNDDVLNLDFYASDVTAMRAGINSFLRWIDVASYVYDLAFSKN